MKIICLIIWSLFTFSGYGQSKLNGTWDTGEDNTVIEITQSGEKTFGKIKSTDNPKATIGKVMIKDLKKNGTIWEGQIYAAKRDDWYDAVLTPKGNILEIKISVGFMSKTVEWKRIE